MGRVVIFPKGPLAPLSLPQPIPQPLKHNMETTLNADLSNIKLREGHEAAQLNTSAFRREDDIFIAPGELQPNTDIGEQLVYHEIGHIWEAQLSPIRPFRPEELSPAAEQPKIAEGLVEVSDSSSAESSSE